MRRFNVDIQRACCAPLPSLYQTSPAVSFVVLRITARSLNQRERGRAYDIRGFRLGEHQRLRAEEYMLLYILKTGAANKRFDAIFFAIELYDSA